MKDPNIIEKYITWPISNLLGSIEYYIAKRWLDKNFGKREYWGNTIAELLTDQTK